MLTKFKQNALSGTSLGALATLPNAITAAGYGATLWWLQGRPKWAAVAGLVADELDGRVARATGQTSEFGSLFDWAVDISLTVAILDRLGVLYAALPVTAAQTLLREQGYRPTIGSIRAALTIAALWKER